MKRIDKYLDLAAKVSKQSDYYHKVGCVITKGSKVIGLGYNNPYKTHPKANNPYRNIHAELQAILVSDRNELIGSTAYISRLHKDNTFALAKPCEHCIALLRKAGIKKAIFTVENGYEIVCL